jgi:hypothetical protein
MFSMIYDGPPLIEIQNAETQCPSGDQIGEVSGGFIQLSGKICPVNTSIFYRIIDDDDFQSEISYFSDDPGHKVTADTIWVLPVTYMDKFDFFDRGHSELICLVLEGNGRWVYQPKDYSRVGLLQIRCLKAPSEHGNDPVESQQPNVLAEAVFTYMSGVKGDSVTIV